MLQIFSHSIDLLKSLKVDTHIHLSAAFSPRDLLEYIEKQLRENLDEVVLKGKTLREICMDADLNLGHLYFI